MRNVASNLLLKRNIGLCGPPLLLSLVDWTVTLLGQPAEYWAGDYTQANERSPTFFNLLVSHPAAFAAGFFLWIGVFVALIVLLPKTPAMMLSLAVAFAHTNGATSWILPHAPYPYQTRIALVCLTAVVAGLGIQLASAAADQQRHGPRPWLRWATITALLAVAAYLFLIPRW
jgi:hypothetical protein